MTINNLYVVLICLSLLNACANKHADHGPSTIKQNALINTATQEKIKQDHVIELIKFYESYASLGIDEQKKIYADTSVAILENGQDKSQHIRLAMMHSLPSSRVRDINKAQILLQDLLQGGNLSWLEYALVNLLYEYTLDSTKQIQKNRDETKKLEAAQTKYENLQQKYDALEQKLNELKNIEKTMNERDTHSANKP
ncbi:MAG: hypothetical protein PHD12_04560 [Methylotenera sp.]|nr:hypothetical protein [Methylotenera sp.]